MPRARCGRDGRLRHACIDAAANEMPLPAAFSDDGAEVCSCDQHFLLGIFSGQQQAAAHPGPRCGWAFGVPGRNDCSKSGLAVGLEAGLDSGRNFGAPRSLDRQPATAGCGHSPPPVAGEWGRSWRELSMQAAQNYFFFFFFFLSRPSILWSQHPVLLVFTARHAGRSARDVSNGCATHRHDDTRAIAIAAMIVSGNFCSSCSFWSSLSG